MNKTDIETGIANIFKDKFGIDYSKEKDNTIESLGLDSLDMLEAIMFFEREFKIAISDDETAGIKTINDLVNFIDKQINA